MYVVQMNVFVQFLRRMKIALFLYLSEIYLVIDFGEVF